MKLISEEQFEEVIRRLADFVYGKVLNCHPDDHETFDLLCEIQGRIEDEFITQRSVLDDDEDVPF